MSSSVMANQILLFISLATLFVSFAHSAVFTFTNNCPYTVWPGLLAGAGPQPCTTGFELATGATTSVNIPAPWSGRFWARAFCSTDPAGKLVCATADCASGQLACNGAGAIPPATLAEFTLAPNAGQDFYDVSLVDGFNLPMSIVPSISSCPSTDCPVDVNAVCPPELAVPNAQGVVIACKSACLAFNEPQYCCTGSYGTPDTCPPNLYSLMFKNKCPRAYSFAYDDKTSIFTCTGGADYHITICP